MTIVAKPAATRRHIYVEKVIESQAQGKYYCHQFKSGAACLGNYGVSFVDSFHSTDGNRVICHFTAPDLESVRLVLRNAGVAVDTMWARA